MKNLSLLIKPVSGSCNMGCIYCFYADVAKIRSIKDYGTMSEETLEIIVKKALEEVTQTCTFAFQGGEPTLVGLNFYKKAVELQKKYNINKTQIQNSIQTNGLLITEEWASFFADNNFLVGISIDGYKSLHDSFRVTGSGKLTHNQCMQTVRLFRKHGVEFNILSVVTKRMAMHPEKLYNFYKNNNFRYIQLIPCIDDFGEEAKSAFSLTDKVYGNFLSQIFNLWYKDFLKGQYYSIRIFDNYIQMLMGKTPESCAMRGKCDAYPLIEADGSVFPCDFFVVDQYRLGNIKEDSFKDMLTSVTAKKFSDESSVIDQQCKTCEYLAICRGGCRRDRQENVGEKLLLNKYCLGYKDFFNHTMSRMIDIAQKLSR